MEAPNLFCKMILIGITNPVLDVARSLDKTVITGRISFNCSNRLGAASGGLSIDYNRECVYDDSGKTCIEKGQLITLDGSTGNIIDGNVVSVPSGLGLSHFPILSQGIQSDFRTLLRWTDKYRR